MATNWRERDPSVTALAAFLADGPPLSPSSGAWRRRVASDVADIDAAISRQVNAILHHPRFRTLEATWRGLRYLIDQTERDRILEADGRSEVFVEVLDVTMVELEKDIDRASDFDRSEFFGKIYSERMDQPGAFPFGLLIGDYEFGRDPSLIENGGVGSPGGRLAPLQSIDLLGDVAQVAAAAFSPFVAAASPHLFGLREYREIDRLGTLRIGAAFSRPGGWSTLRSMDDARFVGLTLPKVCFRLPYRAGVASAHGWICRDAQCRSLVHPDREDRCWCGRLLHTGKWDCPSCGFQGNAPDDTRCGSPECNARLVGDRTGLYDVDPYDAAFYFEERFEPGEPTALFGNAAFPFAAVVARSFLASGWLADIRGVRLTKRPGEERTRLDARCGLVEGLPHDGIGTDRPGVVTRMKTEVRLTDAQEREISEFGFIPLCDLQDTSFLAFFGTPSIQIPAKYDKPVVTRNARISAMLQYVLCTSRFAHYLKVMARDLTGAAVGPVEIEARLKAWIATYVSENASDDDVAKFPLRAADVEISSRGADSGTYYCVIQLLPHSQAEDLEAGVTLRTTLIARERLRR